MRNYAIGDIHGHLDKLMMVHRLIAEDRALTGDAEAPVVHLGDLVDRGPDSAGVIRYLRAGIADGAPWLVLKGNHDRMMVQFLQPRPGQDPRLRADYHWAHPALGGLETMASYGVETFSGAPMSTLHDEAMRKVPREDVDFLDSLPTSLRRDRCLFVHAGIRPGIAFEAQDEEDLIWIRAEFHNDLSDHGALIVHGHTPIDRARHYGNRLNLDSGAAFGRHLTGVVIEGLKVFELTDDGRVPLRPARGAPKIR
jgi:serine/threonine protein phosphatase 1